MVNLVSDNKTIDVLKALADPIRLNIVRGLADCPTGKKSCGDLSAKERLSQPAMSHHFKKLVDAGVIDEVKNGTYKNYVLNKDLLSGMGVDIGKL